ncbi:hypothetical protein CRE_14611 [Caenorhabditis remanei]|uniref:BTB domain-containing protein n=1 Tax=Caenorhabditis remanei TaxID=31234 RepID=E3M929_CAERE|nr:hypothetical protein CRE_14611 [Caenorhabditis remanei]
MSGRRGRKRQREVTPHPTTPIKMNAVEFDGSDPDLFDIILVVEGKKFYVNKKQLALHSMFFHRMFYGGFEEAKKEEIEIKEVSAEDFQKFLEVVHGVEDLEDSTVEAVFDLSDRFDCEHIIKKCKKFLLAHNQVPPKTMLALSIRHNFEELKTKALETVKTKWDMKAILPANLKDLDHPTMSLLLKKSLNISGNASIDTPSDDERDVQDLFRQGEEDPGQIDIRARVGEASRRIMARVRALGP